MDPQQNSSPLRVMVVDDRPAITMTFQWMLEILGHDVRSANNGAEALSTAQEFLPHVILLDITLPDMDGYELAQRLRAMPGFDKCTLIAQTGHSTPEHRERSRNAGFDYHLVKPVTSEQLEHIFATLDFAKAA